MRFRYSTPNHWPGSASKAPISHLVVHWDLTARSTSAKTMTQRHHTSPAPTAHCAAQSSFRQLVGAHGAEDCTIGRRPANIRPDPPKSGPASTNLVPDIGRVWPRISADIQPLSNNVQQSWANVGPTLGQLSANSGPTLGLNLHQVRPNLGQSLPIPANLVRFGPASGQIQIRALFVHFWPNFGHLLANLGRILPTLVDFEQTWADFGQILAEINQIWPTSTKGRTRPNLVDFGQL